MKSSWVIINSDIEKAKKSLMESMKKSEMPSFIKTNWEQNELCVRVEKNGKSEIRLALLAEGDKIKIIETKRSVALLHKPFVGRVETFLNGLMQECGAKIL